MFVPCILVGKSGVITKRKKNAGHLEVAKEIVRVIKMQKPDLIKPFDQSLFNRSLFQDIPEKYKYKISFKYKKAD